MSNNEWKIRPLGEVTYEQTARAGKSLNGLTVYGVDSKIGLTDAPKYAAEKLDKYKIIEPGMFAYNPMRLNIGSIGLCKYSYAKGLVSPDYVVFGCDTENLLPDFLNYAIQGFEWRQWTSAAGVGSVRVRIYYKELARLSLTIPPIAVQKNIVKILSTFDDKIELNRQINQTLEQIAQTIFKSWFVDFEPVKAKIEAKAAGRDPARAAICAISGKSEPELDQLSPGQLQQLAATSALFPDELLDSELGLIPKGWEVRKVEDLLSRLSSKTRYTKDQVKPYGLTPVFEQGTGILLGYHDGTAQFFATPEDPAFIFGDHTCVTHLACEPFDISQNVIPLKGSDRSTIWAYYAVKDKQAFQEYRRHWMELIVKDVVVPPETLCQRFAKTASILHLTIESNVLQNRELSTFRDTLLPKLLSGELSVENLPQEATA